MELGTRNRTLFSGRDGGAGKALLRGLVAAASWISLSMPAAAAGERHNQVIYYPETKAYYELVSFPITDPGYTWAGAAEVARERMFHGIHGRLAVVRQPGLHRFLMTTFMPDAPAWIGLVYHCGLRQLVWSTGEVEARGGFQAWDARWDQSAGAGCSAKPGRSDYMPIAYTPVYHGFRWMAKGAAKVYYKFFVEYPTGQP
jgi:hypothetical protein